MVFNKIDNFNYVQKDEDDLTPAERQNLSLDDIKMEWTGENKHAMFISAKEKENIDQLKDTLYQFVKTVHAARYPFNDFLY